MFIVCVIHPIHIRLIFFYKQTNKNNLSERSTGESDNTSLPIVNWQVIIIDTFHSLIAHYLQQESFDDSGLVGDGVASSAQLLSSGQRIIQRRLHFTSVELAAVKELDDVLQNGIFDHDDVLGDVLQERQQTSFSVEPGTLNVMNWNVKVMLLIYQVSVPNFW